MPIYEMFPNIYIVSFLVCVIYGWAVQVSSETKASRSAAEIIVRLGLIPYINILVAIFGFSLMFFHLYSYFAKLPIYIKKRRMHVTNNGELWVIGRECLTGEILNSSIPSTVIGLPYDGEKLPVFNSFEEASDEIKKRGLPLGWIAIEVNRLIPDRLTEKDKKWFD